MRFFWTTACFLAVIAISLSAQGPDSKPTSKGKEKKAEATKRPVPPTRDEVVAAAEKAFEEAKKAGVDHKKALACLDPAFAKYRAFLATYASAAPADDPVIQTYFRLISVSDDHVEKLLTPDVIAKTPARDMLAEKERGLWGTSKHAGCDFKFDKRGLEVDYRPVEAGKQITEILALDGWTDPAWQDLVIEFEFEILSGSFELYARYTPSFVNYTLIFDASRGFEVGHTYGISMRVIGSKMTLSEADQPESSGPIEPKVSRIGGLAFGLPDLGVRLLIKKLSVKVLRTATSATEWK